MRSKAELDAAIGREFLDAFEDLIDVGFPQTIGMEPLQINRCLLSAASQEPRQDLLLKHTIQFTGHTGGEIEARFADVDSEAAGGADRVVDHFCPSREQRLFAVIRRHETAALAKTFFH